MKPIRDVDAYTFAWPTLGNPTAQRRVETMVESMIEMTYRERVEFLDKWIPALRDQKAAQRAGISAVDQHLVVTALMRWRDDNAECARAAA